MAPIQTVHSMPVIVDTFNVLHTTGVLPPELAGVDLEGLARLIRSSRYARERVTLVCDGFGTENAIDQTSFLQVSFAGLGRSADDLIAELVDRSTAPRLLVVVSSDNQVLRSAKRRGSKRLTAEQFLQQLADDVRALPRTNRPAAKPSAPVPDDEVARWIAHFDLSEKEMSHPPATPPIAPRSRPGETRPDPRHRVERDGARNADNAPAEYDAGEMAPTATPDAKPDDTPRSESSGSEPAEHFGDLPDELIREAESLWNRDASRKRDA